MPSRGTNDRVVQQTQTTELRHQASSLTHIYLSANVTIASFFCSLRKHAACTCIRTIAVRTEVLQPPISQKFGGLSFFSP